MKYLLQAILLLLVCHSSSQAQPPVADLIALTKPGPEHEKLARLAGSWDVAIQMRGASQTLVGTATCRMLVGGRFLQVEYQAKGRSSDLEGVFIIGFDSRHQRFALVALDSFGTYFVTSQGQRDDAGKPKLLGSDDDPQMKALGYSKEFAHVLDFQNNDQFAIEVRFLDTRTAARKEIRYMEFQFTRGK